MKYDICQHCEQLVKIHHLNKHNHCPECAKELKDGQKDRLAEIWTIMEKEI